MDCAKSQTGRGLFAALLLLTLVAPSHHLARAQTAAAAAAVKPAAAAVLTAAEREAAARLRVETIREVTADLSAKEMEGRGTAQPGGDRAARYLADRIAKLGFKPLGDAGTFLQAIKFRSTQVMPESVFTAGTASLKLGEDYVVAPPYTYEQSDAAGGIVFVGYGVTSAELKRDDLAGLDVKGKVVVLVSGRPKGIDEAAWEKASNQRGTLLGLLGRGAAAVVLTNVGSKDQPYSMLANYLTRRRSALASTPEPPFKLPPILLMSDAGVEKLFAGSGTTFAQTLARAEAGEAVSRDLQKTANISIRIKREEGTGANVVGVLEGSDPKLKEQAVLYTAHYDAYGLAPGGLFYPGAADNALGVAEMVAIAEAFAKAPARPRRSIIFLAVTGEEHGMLGSEHWAQNPTWPLEKVAADLNFDGIGTEIYGPVKNIVGFGMEHSDLGPTLEAVVTAIGGKIVPDPMPEEKAFYRSDHYSFVKKGVPALMLLGGPEGETSVWVARSKKWTETDYHQTTDIIRPDWNWDGARTVAVIGLLAGMRIADAEQMPAWLSSSPFNKPRGNTAPAPPEQ